MESKVHIILVLRFEIEISTISSEKDNFLFNPAIDDIISFDIN